MRRGCTQVPPRWRWPMKPGRSGAGAPHRGREGLEFRAPLLHRHERILLGRRARKPLGRIGLPEIAPDGLDVADRRAVPRARVGSIWRGSIMRYSSERCSCFPRSTGTSISSRPFSAGQIRTRREWGEPADWWSFIRQGADHLAELSISHVLYSPVIGALGVATCRLRWGGALRAR